LREVKASTLLGGNANGKLSSSELFSINEKRLNFVFVSEDSNTHHK
jgi:hypothetical protein